MSERQSYYTIYLSEARGSGLDALAAKRATRVRRRDVDGKPYTEVVTPDVRSLIYEAIDLLLEQEGIVNDPLVSTPPKPRG